MARGARPLIALLVCASLGCDAGPRAAPERTPERTPEPTPEPTPDPASGAGPPAADPEPSTACELGPLVLHPPLAPGARLALALGESGGLLARVDGAALHARPIEASGEPAGPWATATLPGEGRVLAMSALEDGALVLLEQPCEGHPRCLVALTLDRAGVASALATAPLPGPVLTLRRASAARGALLAWSAASGRAGLVRVEANGAAAPRLEARELAGEDLERPAEILAAAAEGERAERWAVVWRRGAAEDVRAEVRVTAHDRDAAVEALGEALVIELARLEGDTLHLVAGFEFSRPHAITIELGQPEPRRAEELPPGASAPPPLDARARGRLDVDERGLWLRVTSPVGDPIGSPARLHDGAVTGAALARTADAFLAAWVDEAGSIRSRTVACDTP